MYVECLVHFLVSSCGQCCYSSCDMASRVLSQYKSDMMQQQYVSTTNFSFFLCTLCERHTNCPLLGVLTFTFSFRWISIHSCIELWLAYIKVNLVLDDAIEYSPDPSGEGLVRTELKSEILLNGNQIAVLVPGGAPPGDSLAAQQQQASSPL